MGLNVYGFVFTQIHKHLTHFLLVGETGTLGERRGGTGRDGERRGETGGDGESEREASGPVA